MTHILKSLYRSLLPVSLRVSLAEARRRYRFRRALQRFCEHPESCATPNSPLLHELIREWNNSAWGGKSEYLAECVVQALQCMGSILECGSGLSTLLVGAIATQRGQSLWSLEHKPEWAAKLRPLIESMKFTEVRLIECELRDRGNYLWYDPPLELMPDQFALVICDGPPGHGKGGRYGLVPIMRERLAPGCIVLLDDVNRENERAIAERWRKELGATSQTFGTPHDYVRMTLAEGSR